MNFLRMICQKAELHGETNKIERKYADNVFYGLKIRRGAEIDVSDELQEKFFAIHEKRRKINKF